MLFSIEFLIAILPYASYFIFRVYVDAEVFYAMEVSHSIIMHPFPFLLISFCPLPLMMIDFEILYSCYTLHSTQP